MANPFEQRAAEYDAWFDAHPELYESELLALQALLPERPGRWVEVGVGTGRFASRLGIGLGIEPAEAMALFARSRGVEVLTGAAEDLPLLDRSVDAVFLITVVGFLESVERAFSEVHRVLRPGGHLVLAFIPRESPLGRIYSVDGGNDAFFACAHLRSVSEIESGIARAGLLIERELQTLTELSPSRTERPRDGTERGSFVVLRAVKPIQADSVLTGSAAPSSITPWKRNGISSSST
jgi:SAM-dependent methyltransferase